ncbi:MAG: ABC transporter permease [Thermomicrobiales bacterium]
MTTPVATDNKANDRDHSLAGASFTNSRQRSLTRDAMIRLRRNKAAVTGLAIIIIVLLLAILAPLLAPYNPNKQDLLQTYATPSRSHLLGTDILGRDILSRLLFGARVSMSVALVTTTLAVLIGLPIGLASGFIGGKTDFIIMRIVDAFYAFPDLLFIIIISTYLNAALPHATSGFLLVLKHVNDFAGGLAGVFIALALFGWLGLSRVVRGQVLSIRNREYVTSAESIGAGKLRIMFLHILPNSLAPIIILVALLLPQFIIAEAGLSFIGLGVQPPNASWGIMISEGVPALRAHPHVMLVPGITLSITLLAFNFFGDGLRDALDPSMH